MWLTNTIHTYNGILAIEKNEILPFVTTWTDLESIKPSEISQKKTNTVWFHLYVGSKKQNKWTNITKEKQNQAQNKQVVAQGEAYRGREISEGD